MATTITTTDIKTIFGPNELLENLFTGSAGSAETFVFSLRAADQGAWILLKNAGADACSYSFSEGILGMPAHLNDGAVNTVEAGKSAVLKLDSAFAMKKDGTIELSVTPASGKALSLSIAVVQDSLTA